MHDDVLRKDESLVTGHFMPATGSKQRLNGPQLDHYESKTRFLCSYPDVSCGGLSLQIQGMLRFEAIRGDSQTSFMQVKLGEAPPALHFRMRQCSSAWRG